MPIIRRPQLQCGKLEAVNQIDSKYAIGDKLNFFDCHKLQPDWIKYQSLHKGVVKGVYRQHRSMESIYKAYFPYARCRKFLPENELESEYFRAEQQCPWGQIENISSDGILVKVMKVNTLKSIVEEAVCCLHREVKEFHDKAYQELIE